MDRKLYAGARLREIRTGLGLTQSAFAEKLGVSLSYINQMENNHRPISRTAVQGLAREFGVDIESFSLGEAEKLMAELTEALADPMFEERPGEAEIEIAATNAPRLAKAFILMQQALRQTAERLASWTKRWTGRARRRCCSPGRRSATSSTIATTISMSWTAPRSSSREPPPSWAAPRLEGLSMAPGAAWHPDDLLGRSASGL